MTTQVKSSTLFDNIIATDDPALDKTFVEETWGKHKEAVWNAITNNQVVQGFRRSLHDDLPTETRLSHMLSRGSLEWLLNMRNMKLWMKKGNCWRGRETGQTTYRVQAAVSSGGVLFAKPWSCLSCKV
uniref:Retrovirus-related Pol polyprotein LINE-1 n=1 Tax=Zea mays TaxID=4577 RepID=A0A804PR95_MAIZE